MALADLMTAEWIRERYLILLPNQADITDDAIDQWRDAAVRRVQTSLGIVFDLVTITEKYTQTQRQNEWPNLAPIPLQVRPVRSITSVEAKWGVVNVFTVPASWIQMQQDGFDMTGLMTLIPGPSLIASSSFWLGWWRNGVRAPLFWHVTYTAGWEDEEDIPADLLDLIGWEVASSACRAVFAGLLQGMESVSATLDGQTTGKSKGTGLLGAITSLQKDTLGPAWQVARAGYRRVSVFVQ